MINVKSPDTESIQKFEHAQNILLQEYRERRKAIEDERRKSFESVREQYYRNEDRAIQQGKPMRDIFFGKEGYDLLQSQRAVDERYSPKLEALTAKLRRDESKLREKYGYYYTGTEWKPPVKGRILCNFAGYDCRQWNGKTWRKIPYHIDMDSRTLVRDSW